MAGQSEETDQEKEALKFLDRDFNQCFNQMRHYNAQIFDTSKFAFTGYIGVVGFALTLFQFGLKEKIDLALPALASLAIGLILGLFMFFIVIRNRVYFVQASRYINEQRRLFLKYRPLGFLNESKMYTDPALPPYWDYRSSQAWFSFVLAFLNAILLFVNLLIYSRAMNEVACIYLIGLPFLLFVVQLFGAYLYLKSRENKSAERSVFGRGN